MKESKVSPGLSSLGGRSFHSRGPAAEKLLSPSLLCVRGTISFRMSQWATTNVRQKATVVCEVSGSTTVWLIHWVVDLRPTRRKIGYFGDVSPSQSLCLVWKKLNPTQQKHTFTNQEKCTQRNKQKHLKPGLVNFYDIRPGKRSGLIFKGKDKGETSISGKACDINKQTIYIYIQRQNQNSNQGHITPRSPHRARCLTV